MKKFFSLFAAVLFAGSMMADVVTLDPATQEPQTSETDINITVNGIGVAYHGTLNAAAEVNGIQQPADFRVFAAQKLKLSSATNKIEKVVIAGYCKKEFTLNVDKGTVSTGASYADETTKAELTDPLIVVENIGNNSVTLTCGKQIRAYKIEVTLGEASQAVDDDPVVTADTLTCAQAADLAKGGNTDEKIIKGYVVEIAEAWSSYKNVSFWMADTKGGEKTFEAFRVKCETAAEAPTVGALVWVKGNLTLYKSTPETAQGGTFGILEAGEVEEPAKNLGAKTIAEFLALKDTKDTCILTGVVSNIVNDEYGNFDLTDETGKVYVYGLLTADGKNKQFASLGVAEGDTLTCKAIYNEYNGNAQAKNAIFVSVKEGEGPQGGETVELDVEYAEALYIEEQGIWQLNLYKDWDSETETVTYPDLYIGVTPKSATTLAGTYTIDDEEIAFIEVDMTSTKTVTATETSDLVVTYLGDGVYAYELEFVGDDNNTYILDVELETYAFDYSTEEEIELTDVAETAVETTKVDNIAVKSIRNATLIIERNGVRHTVLGQTVR